MALALPVAVLHVGPTPFAQGHAGGRDHTVPLRGWRGVVLKLRNFYLAAGSPRHPIGRFFGRGGREAAALLAILRFGRLRSPFYIGLLAVLAKKFLGALRAQSEGQGNLSMHPQGDNLCGYSPITHFLAYFRLVLGATNSRATSAPRFLRPLF